MRKLIKKIDARAASALVLLVMLFVQLVMHMNADNLLADDWVFFGVLDGGQNPLAYLAGRWQTWSSRLLIEGALIFTTHSIWAWRVLDTLMMAMMAWGMCRLADGRVRPGLLGLSCLLVTAIPFAILRSTGWQATSMNYYWPMACTFMALIPLGDGLRGQRTRPGLSAAAVVCALLAANQEQFAAALAGTGVAVAALLLVRRRRISPAMWAVTAIALAQLAMHLLCPGNAVRSEQSIAAVNLRDYGQFSLIDKLSIGLTSTTALLFSTPNPMLVVCGACVVGAMLSRKRGAAAYGVAAGVALVYVVAAYAPAELAPTAAAYRSYVLQLGPARYAGAAWPGIVWLKALILSGCGMIMGRRRVGNACAVGFAIVLGAWTLRTGFAVDGQMDMLLILVLTLGLLALALYLCLGHRGMAAAAVFAYAVGFAARMALSLSPTVVESGERTMLPLYGAMMLCALLCVKDCEGEGGRRWPLCLALCAVLAVAATNVAGSFALAA